jgi:luciferase family oxidoreductase group 1
MSYRLSLLDKSPVPDGSSSHEAVATTIAYAELADRLGYHRIWFAEHHGLPGVASAAPEIIISHVLASTRRIRVGSGGVLLQHYAPFKVAEVFSVLATLGRGRLDLGIGRAPGGLPATTKALQAETAEGKAEEFERKLEELDGFLRGSLPSDHPLAGAHPNPLPPVLPELFLLGSSAASAALAARLGWNFVHGGHHNGDPAVARQTLSAFGSVADRRPLYAVTAFAADTRAEAQRRVEKLGVQKLTFSDGHSVKLGSSDGVREYVRQYRAWRGELAYFVEEIRPNLLVGTAEDIHLELERLHRTFGVEEFVIDQPIADREARLRSAELIAQERALVAA